ncbi:MAG: 5'-deoxynucleotidase [Oscillospiraceae bacterium]|jgi:5'-deoxynucleotidase|nr:5'-deoxynucleotidase [Oscillospiraceae bacterium]
MTSFFALVARLKNINRWALMRNAVTENVQEHSHMTAVIAHALAVIRRDVLGGDADPGGVAAAGLFHDATEIMTGDMPTPIKYLSESLTGAYKQAERTARERLLMTLPEKMRPAYAGLLGGGDDGETRKLVHAADKIAAYIKCLEEEKAGNREFRLAAEQTREKIRALCIPEADYFMEHFCCAFELTLDELAL